MRRCFVCHYHEIALKKKNRDFFERRLIDNIRLALTGLSCTNVRKWSSRVIVELEDDSDFDEVSDRLSRVFGIANYARAWIVSSEITALQTTVWELIRNREFTSFKVAARRADKTYPLTSPEIGRVVGAFVVQCSGAKVRLREPDLTCYLQILGKDCLVQFERLKGAGGLPTSTGGRVAVLLSGGIDSPVAAYKVMKRGCRPAFVHFHSHPHTSLEAQEKVVDLARILCRNRPSAPLYMVPFAPVQRQIVASTPARTRVILYRRMMVRIANRIARWEKAKALVTGDSIGQVSSQTLDNLMVVSDASILPILRPLVGDDKDEIVQLSRKIGTFGISVGADDDCCSMFIPRHPECYGRIDRIREIEESLDIQDLVDKALQDTRKERIAGVVEDEADTHHTHVANQHIEAL